MGEFDALLFVATPATNHFSFFIEFHTFVCPFFPDWPAVECVVFSIQSARGQYIDSCRAGSVSFHFI
jgi:hypothetical protein